MFASDIALDKQEILYRAAFPVVRMFWSLWLLAALFFPYSLAVAAVELVPDIRNPYCPGCTARYWLVDVMSEALYLLATYLFVGAGLRLSKGFAIALLAFWIPALVLSVGFLLLLGFSVLLGRVDYSGASVLWGVNYTQAPLMFLSLAVVFLSVQLCWYYQFGCSIQNSQSIPVRQDAHRRAFRRGHVLNSPVLGSFRVTDLD